MSFLDDNAYARLSEHEAPRLALFKAMARDFDVSAEIRDAPDTRPLGVDYIVLCRSGRVWLVQEKLRRTTYDDFLCEVWSRFYPAGDRQNVVGWTLNLAYRARILTYVIVPLGVAYVLDAYLLRKAAWNNFESWIQDYGYRPPPEVNTDYATMNVAVPWDRLARDMGRTEPIRTYPWVLP